jgi:alpha-tubulin suppressor-like RCC1 family protein
MKKASKSLVHLSRCAGFGSIYFSMFVLVFALGFQYQANAAEPVGSQIAMGENHSCVLTSAGGVKCWGYNVDGRLGDGTTINRPTPVNVFGLMSGVAAITAGDKHTCALTTVGGVKCWGLNNDGRLGDGTTINQPTPVNVSGLSGVAAITAGAYHTCALTTAGTVKCWGNNLNGQLGHGSATTVLSTTSGEVSGLPRVVAIAAGGTHTCALTTVGKIMCWGSNAAGSLGNGNTISSTTPVEVSGLNSDVAAIAAGAGHTCALTAAGVMMCWGDNGFGQLGNHTTVNSNTPVVVLEMTSGVAALGAGRYHTCALTAAGGVKCWGDNFDGQLGNGITANSSTPVDVRGLTSGVAVLAAGRYYTCVLTTVGGVKCWGDILGGLPGGGGATAHNVPADVPGFASGVAAITAGASHTCALTTSGGVKCWGSNTVGQLGESPTTGSNTPVDVSGLTGVATIAAGSSHNCALTTAGGVKCWGNNIYGQLGDRSSGNVRTTPVNVDGLASGVAAIAAGGYLTCALTTAGGVKCWGYNAFGQLGNDNRTDVTTTPVDVFGLNSGVVAIEIGQDHTCALTTAGGMKCWGYNGFSQLGDRTTTLQTRPIDVLELTGGVVAVAAGQVHTCALSLTGGVKCWGAGSLGQVGANSSSFAFDTPMDVSGLTAGVAAIAAGGNHNCALTTEGGVKCWGDNFYGQLGNNSTTVGYAPVDVSELTSGVAAIAAGINHTCALTTANELKCWGDNRSGQLGDGSMSHRATPTNVVMFETGQSITSFRSPSSLDLRSTATLGATASSALLATFDTFTPTTCTVSSAGLVTPAAPGLCMVRALQAGNASFKQAPTLTRQVQISNNTTGGSRGGGDGGGGGCVVDLNADFDPTLPIGLLFALGYVTCRRRGSETNLTGMRNPDSTTEAGDAGLLSVVCRTPFVASSIFRGT